MRLQRQALALWRCTRVVLQCWAWAAGAPAGRHERAGQQQAHGMWVSPPGGSSADLRQSECLQGEVRALQPWARAAPAPCWRVFWGLSSTNAPLQRPLTRSPHYANDSHEFPLLLHACVHLVCLHAPVPLTWLTTGIQASPRLEQIPDCVAVGEICSMQAGYQASSCLQAGGCLPTNPLLALSPHHLACLRHCLQAGAVPFDTFPRHSASPWRMQPRPPRPPAPAPPRP